MRTPPPDVSRELPPAGPARGLYDVPRWAVGGAGTTVVVFGLAYLVARHTRRRSRR